MPLQLLAPPITSQSNTWPADQTYNDDVLVRWGTDGDAVLVLNSAGLSANEELTGVIVGTSIYANAIPANSLIISNITDDGDIVFFTATGGNSIEAIRIDASTRQVILPIIDDAVTPSWAFGDGGYGFYSSGDDVVRLSIAGAATYRWNSADFRTGTAGLQTDVASGTNANVLPNINTDSDTGLGTNAADELSHIAGGFEMLRLKEHTAQANYVGALFDAPDQVDLSAATGSTWRLIQTQAVNVDFTDDGDDPITALNGLALYLGVITVTSNDALTVTTASTLYVTNPVDGSGLTFTNNYPINTASGAFLTAAGVWTDNPSTRLKKHDILDVTPEYMKQAIAQIRPRSWVYNDEWGDEGRMRFGVVAEEQPDFLYGLGTTQRNVTSPSIMAGFALAGLSYHEDRIDDLEQECADLRDKIAVLEAR